MDAQKLVEAVSKALACIWVQLRKQQERKTFQWKAILGTPRCPQLSQGVNGSLDLGLKCWYCKDVKHEKKTESGYRRGYAMKFNETGH